ncbi:MAG: phosphatidate cytidylyltransferase [Gemmatimonadota bacterium]|nr:phosphatidate cytidylyltransferase [Gemmatimonadota bacterium]
MASSLPRRIAVAAVGIPTALGLVYVGGWILAAVLAVVGVLGTHELFRLARAKDVRPLGLLGYAAAALAPLALFGILNDRLLPPLWIGYAAIAWVIAIMAGAVFRRPPASGPLAAVAVTVFAPAYTGLLPSFLLVIRHGNAAASPWAATWLVFLPLVVTWVCDSMAMAGGALIGGPKFAPVVSPNKTWAGTVTGSVSAGLVAPVYGWLALRPHDLHPGVVQLVLLGILLSALGQVGDLAESLFKREAGVKDSGTVFPGHGGVLDRFDSLYWVLPGAAALLALYGIL